MNLSVNQSFFCLLLLVTNLATAEASTKEFPLVMVQVNQQSFSLEYAHSRQQRAQGLMHRQQLCEECGMLFNFQRNKRAQMWMKNTYIPLDVAFIREDGSISEIHSMQANTAKLTKSRYPVFYAWEMNLGWFAKNAIKVGDIVTINALE